MIAIEWWVPVLVGVIWLAVTAAVFFMGRAYVNARVDIRVLELFDQYLTEHVPDPAPQPAHQPSPPWMTDGTDYQYLPEPHLPPVDTSWRPFGTRPDGSVFTGDDTASFDASELRKPEPVRTVEPDEPAPGPRPRFSGEPKGPVEATVTTKVGETVVSGSIEVPR